MFLGDIEVILTDFEVCLNCFLEILKWFWDMFSKYLANGLRWFWSDRYWLFWNDYEAIFEVSLKWFWGDFEAC